MFCTHRPPVQDYTENPDQRQQDALEEGEVLSVHAPDVARCDAEADVPCRAQVTVVDDDQGDDHLADEDRYDRLPDRKATSDERPAELPICQAGLVDGPEGDRCPSALGAAMRW